MDWKKFQSNNKTIALNILYVRHSTEKLSPAYISKHCNSTHEILLMIMNGEKMVLSCHKELACVM